MEKNVLFFFEKLLLENHIEEYRWGEFLNMRTMLKSLNKLEIKTIVRRILRSFFLVRLYLSFSYLLKYGFKFKWGLNLKFIIYNWRRVFFFTNFISTPPTRWYSYFSNRKLRLCKLLSLSLCKISYSNERNLIKNFEVVFFIIIPLIYIRHRLIKFVTIIAKKVIRWNTNCEQLWIRPYAATMYPDQCVHLWFVPIHPPLFPCPPMFQ